MARSTHDAPAASAQTARWWIDGPIFSTRRGGARITTLAPGTRPGRVDGEMVLRALAVFAFWAVLGFFGLSRLFSSQPVPWVEEMSRQWWWYVIIAVGALTIVTQGAFGLYARTVALFGQHRLAALVVALPTTLGILAALLVHLGIFAVYLDEPPAGVPAWQLPDPQIMMIFAAVAAVTSAALLVAVPVAGAAVRRAQRRIAQMRENGTRTTGTLEERTFTDERISNLSRFETVIMVDLPDGPTRVRAQMNTAPERVPLIGEALAVFVSQRIVRGRTRTDYLIEPDDTRPLRFEWDSTQFTVATSDGGGSG